MKLLLILSDIIISMDTKENNLCTLYLVRHGETEWNVKGITQETTSSKYC